MEAFAAQSSGAGNSRVPVRRVTVTTTARLHFGFLDPSGRGPRPFGSFGLSLDRPRTRLSLERANAMSVSGTEAERSEGYLRDIASTCGMARSYALRIEEAIPSHAGLGSGTQLALAVGAAFAALEGVSLSPEEIALKLGRGSRSGIGIATFAEGGAVLDAGPGSGSLPPLLSRVAFPPEWRVLLIFDSAVHGLAGANETAAFAALPDFPHDETAELSRRVTQGAFPAIKRRDFAEFCAAISDLQASMAAYFARLQGGPYTSEAVGETLAWFSRKGRSGLGQSSWGPTGFAFASSAAEGEALLAEARASASSSTLRFDLARGRNEGARIEIAHEEIP
jgi:beta-ribofuranosylaminobenzene 5'-phosphate synthase